VRIYLEEILISAASLSCPGRHCHLAFYFLSLQKTKTKRPTKNERSRGLFVNPGERAVPPYLFALPDSCSSRNFALENISYSQGLRSKCTAVLFEGFCRSFLTASPGGKWPRPRIDTKQDPERPWGPGKAACYIPVAK